MFLFLLFLLTHNTLQLHLTTSLSLSSLNTSSRISASTLKMCQTAVRYKGFKRGQRRPDLSCAGTTVKPRIGLKTYEVHLMLNTTDLKVGNQLPVLVKETDAISVFKAGHKMLSLKKALL